MIRSGNDERIEGPIRRKSFIYFFPGLSSVSAMSDACVRPFRVEIDRVNRRWVHRIDRKDGYVAPGKTALDGIPAYPSVGALDDSPFIVKFTQIRCNIGGVDSGWGFRVDGHADNLDVP